MMFNFRIENESKYVSVWDFSRQSFDGNRNSRNQGHYMRCVGVLLIPGTGNGERGTGNGERGTGNGSLGTSVQR